MGTLLLNMGSGNDDVTVESSATIDKSATINFGNGNNNLDFAGTVGPVGGTATALTVNAGRGSNIVTLFAGTHVNGNARLLFGSGSNLFSLQDAAVITGTTTANGGGNAASTFHGKSNANHVTLVIVGFGIIDNSANP